MAADMEVMFPVELTLLDSSASCFLSLGENRTVPWWPVERKRRNSVETREKGTLAIVEVSFNNFLLTGTNIGLWFHYFKHCDVKHT